MTLELVRQHRDALEAGAIAKARLEAHVELYAAAWMAGEQTEARKQGEEAERHLRALLEARATAAQVMRRLLRSQ